MAATVEDLISIMSDLHGDRGHDLQALQLHLSQTLPNQHNPNQFPNFGLNGYQSVSAANPSFPPPPPASSLTSQASTSYNRYLGDEQMASQAAGYAYHDHEPPGLYRSSGRVGGFVRNAGGSHLGFPGGLPFPVRPQVTPASSFRGSNDLRMVSNENLEQDTVLDGWETGGQYSGQPAKELQALPTVRQRHSSMIDSDMSDHHATVYDSVRPTYPILLPTPPFQSDDAMDYSNFKDDAFEPLRLQENESPPSRPMAGNSSPGRWDGFRSNNSSGFARICTQNDENFTNGEIGGSFASSPPVTSSISLISPPAGTENPLGGVGSSNHGRQNAWAGRLRQPRQGQ